MWAASADLFPKPDVTPSESLLVRAADRRRMPPVRKHGKVIRPSSAQAKLQTAVGTSSAFVGGGAHGAILEETTARPQTAAASLYGGGGRSRQQSAQQQQIKSK